jgi:hypothetical protein
MTKAHMKQHQRRQEMAKEKNCQQGMMKNYISNSGGIKKNKLETPYGATRWIGFF